MAEEFTPLTVEKLATIEGVRTLNNMLQYLFDKITADGDDRDIVFGYGTPESNLTKNVGALFLRLDGGANTTFYVKESGTGDTGWISK